MARRQRRASAGPQIGQIPALHDRVRQTSLAAKQHQKGGHARYSHVVVAKEIGHHLYTETSAALQIARIEDRHRRRRLAWHEGAQPFDRLIGGNERERLRLRLNGAYHIEAVADIRLTEDAQLHGKSGVYSPNT